MAHHVPKQAVSPSVGKFSCPTLQVPFQRTNGDTIDLFSTALANGVISVTTIHVKPDNLQHDLRRLVNRSAFAYAHLILPSIPQKANTVNLPYRQPDMDAFHELMDVLQRDIRDLDAWTAPLYLSRCRAGEESGVSWNTLRRMSLALVLSSR